ncbi:hypothetical protein BH11PSE10_BH11PSE10_03410 [soil metagenome]
MLHALNAKSPPSSLHGIAPLKLIWYEPSGSGQARAIGAVWHDERRLHWATPLQRRFEGIANPLPFMLAFADAQTERAHFEAALAWFDAMCFAATDVAQVRAACANEPEWRLRCLAYEGPRQGADLSALLRAAPHWAQITTEQIRTAVLESVGRLAREHPGLAEMPLEPIHDGTLEVGRLHVTEGRRVRVLLHPDASRIEATTLALMADDQLRSKGDLGDRALLVMPQLCTPRPLRPTRRVAVAGLEFGVLARGLLELAMP